jgi:WD40 repeat protein
MVPLGCGIVSPRDFEFRFQVPETDLLPVRTGQAHRTLLGHTGPVTCLQFDEIHIASGSLDKTLRVGYSLQRSTDAYSVIDLGSSNRWYI